MQRLVDGAFAPEPQLFALPKQLGEFARVQAVFADGDERALALFAQGVGIFAQPLGFGRADVGLEEPRPK